MRKLKLLFLILVLLLGLAIFAGCGETEVKVTSISMSGDVTTIAIGEFYYDNYSVTVTYDDGTTKIVALTEDMLSATERIKLLQEGKHTLTVSAFGQTCEFAIEVKRRTIDNATFESMSNATNYVQATYDEKKGWYHFESVYTGDPYVVTVGGLLPDGYTVNFPEGNSFTNAGEYEISAIISCSQYTSKTIYALVTINKADYDFSELKLENKVYEYDGTMKYLNYEGKLPEGLTGKYYIGGNASGIDMVEGNGAEKAGIYYVALVISGGDKNNYNDIVNPYAILNIKKKEINIDDLQWTESEFVYDSNPHEVRIWDQNIPEGLNPAISYEDNIKYEAGTYTAIAKLSVLDPANYTVQPYVEKEFVIKQAEYDLSGIGFESTIADYDGEEKVLECTFGKDYELPQGLTIEYSENRFTNVGVYEVTLTFNNEDVNFVTPEPLSANLVIFAQKHALSEYSFPSIECSYDGNEHELPTILNLPEYFSVEYTYSYSFVSEGSLGMTESGYIVKPAIDEDGNVVKVEKPDTYTVFAKVSVVDENYAIEGVDEVSATLKIFAPAINMYPYEIGFIEPEKPFAFNGQTQGAALAIPENSAYDIEVFKFIDDGGEGDWLSQLSDTGCTEEITYGGIVPGKYQVNIVLYYPAYKEDMIANGTAMVASMEFEIVNAVYTKETFVMEDKIVEFNGEVQGIEIEELPFGVTATYTMVPRGEIAMSSQMTKPGIYDVTATIKVDDEYKDYIESIDSVTATLMVTKCEINLTKASVLAEYAYDANYSVYPYDNEGNEVFPFTTDRNDIMTKPNQSSGVAGNFELGNATINYWFTLKKEGGDTKQHAYAIDQIDPDTIIGNYSVYLHLSEIDTDCVDMKIDDVLVSKDTTEILMYEFAITYTATINISGLSLSGDTRYVDSSSHTYTLSGTIPQHVNVKYTYTVGSDTTVKEGNSFKDVGVYHLKATLTPESAVYLVTGTTEYTATITINPLEFDYNSFYIGLTFTDATSAGDNGNTTLKYYQLATVNDVYTSSTQPNFYFGNGSYPSSSAKAFYIKSGDNYNPIDLSYFRIRLAVVAEGNTTTLINTYGSGNEATSGALGNIYKVTMDRHAEIIFTIVPADSRVTITNMPMTPPDRFEISFLIGEPIAFQDFFGVSETVATGNEKPVVFAESGSISVSSSDQIVFPQLNSDFSDKITVTYENASVVGIRNSKYWSTSMNSTADVDYKATVTFTCKDGYIFGWDTGYGPKTIVMELTWSIKVCWPGE